MDFVNRILELLPASRRGNAVLGMDIGTDAVRLALVEREGRQPVVRWVHEESLTALQGFADYESVAPLLQAALRGRFDKRVDVATVPPWSSARVTVQEFPAMDSGRFFKAAHWHFQRNPVDDMDHPLHTAVPQANRTTPEGGEVMDGVMVSMDEVMLGGLEELCSRLRLRLRSLLPRPLCYAPLVAEQCGEKHTVLAVDVGAGQTRLTLLVDGNVRLVRRIKPCANDVVRHVCDAAALSWEDANNALLAHSGVGSMVEEDPEGIAARAKEPAEKYLDRLAKQLTGEIERSIAYVEARHSTVVQKVLLSGGLAGSPYLFDELVSAISHDVERLDPFAASDLDIADGARTHYNLAIGAATLALNGDGVRNILRARSGNRHGGGGEGNPSRGVPLPRGRVATIAAAIGLVFGLGSYDFVQSRALHRIEGQQERAALRLERLSAEADSLGNHRDLFDLADRIEALRDLYDQRQLYTPFLAKVVSELPPDVWLTQLAVTQVKTAEHARTPSDTDEGDGNGLASAAPGEHAHRIVLAGRSLEVDHVGEVVLQLERSRSLARIEVLKIDEVKEGAEDSGGYRFRIEGTPIIAPRTTRAEEIDEPEVAR